MRAMVIRPAQFIVALLLASTLATAGPRYHSYSLAIEPWGFQQTDSGISPRFIQFLAAQANLDVQTEVRPYLRVLDGVKTGANAITMWVPTPERDQIGIALCQPAAIRIYLSYKQANPVRDLAGLRGKNVGELRGSHTLDRLNREAPHHRVLINDMAQGFRMLSSGHLDGTICVYPGCGTAMKAAGVEPAEFGQVLYQAMPIAVYVSKRSSLAKDEAAMATMRAACESKQGKQLMEKLIAPFD